MAQIGDVRLRRRTAMKSTNRTWPNGKRIAVVTAALLETWSDGKSPSYLPRTTALPPGEPDLPARQWSQYGPEEGMWRILDILDRFAIPATIFSNGLSAEQYPRLV